MFLYHVFYFETPLYMGIVYVVQAAQRGGGGGVYDNV
jgi:hypothetical protein